MKLTCCVACLGLALAAPAVADDEAAYVPPEFIAVAPTVPGAPADVWRLTLTDALQLAVRANLGVVLEREALAISRGGVDLARGEREPVLAATYRHGDLRSPPSNALEGGGFQATDDALSLGYRQRFATGLELGLTLDGARTSSTSDFAANPLNLRSSVAVSLRQPLLRGFSLDLVIPRLAILRAHLGAERERRQLEIAIAEVVEQTESAYWDVVAALYRHDLAVGSAQRAIDQLELTRRQIDAGLLPPSDVINAEGTVAERRLQQVQAELAVAQSWDALRAVLNLPRDQWARPILPVERPGFTPGALTVEQAMAVALANRPERAQLDLDVAEAGLAVRQADNDRLPQIDLGVTGSLTGQDTGYGGALRQVGRVDAPGWTVMVDASWTPLQRATGAAAEIQRRRARIATARQEQLVQTMWAEVRAALRNQESAARQVAAAAEFRRLAEQSLELEQRKFMNGTSSNFFVAQRQEEVAAAQLAELAALLDHTKAATTLARATGVLLTERGIVVE